MINNNISVQYKIYWNYYEQATFNIIKNLIRTICENDPYPI
jgi:hypothetical protein